MTTWERLLLGIIVLEIPIQVDAYLFFQEQWADYGAVGGVNLSVSTLCLGILYAMWLAKYAATAGYPFRQPLSIGAAPTAYLSVAMISFIFAQNGTLAINSIALLVQAFLIYQYVAHRAQSRSDIRYLFGMLLLALATQGAIMIGLYAVGEEVRFGPVAGTISSDYRVGGTIGSPVTGASYLALTLAPALAVLATSLPRRYKLLAVGAVVLGGVALLLTLTRGAWLSVAISAGLLVVLAWYRRFVSFWMPATFAIGLVLVGVAFQATIADRLLGDDEGSARSRIPLIHLALNMIGDHPITGVGINNAAVAGTSYAEQPQFRSEWFYTVHDKYLLEWVELGIFGLAAFVWFLLSTIRTGWATWQRQDPLLAPLALGLLLAIVGQTLHMAVDVFNSRPQVQSLWLCAGLIVALSRTELTE